MESGDDRVRHSLPCLWVKRAQDLSFLNGIEGKAGLRGQRLRGKSFFLLEVDPCIEHHQTRTEQEDQLTGKLKIDDSFSVVDNE